MYVKLTYPRFKAFDSNGNFAADYEVWSYEADTTTDLTTYSDRECTIPNTQPVVLDPVGEADIYVSQAAKLILTIPGGDPTSPIWVQDYLGEMQANFITGVAGVTANPLSAATVDNNYVVCTIPPVPALANNFHLIMTPDVDNADTIVSNTFTGTGSNDCTATGPYLGADSGAIFSVEIDGVFNALPAAPTGAETADVGVVTTGTHYVKVSEVTAVGESLPGVRSAAIVATGLKTIALAGCLAGSDRVLSRNIYMTAIGGAELMEALHTAHWTLGAGWVYETVPDRLSKTGDGLGTVAPAVATAIVAGVTYKVVFTVDSISVSSATWSLGGTAGTPLTAAATYTEYITATNTTDLIITPVLTGLRMKISAISVKSVPDDFYYVGEIADNATETFTVNVADADLLIPAPTTDTTGTGDTFTWKKDAAIGAAGVSITAAAQILTEGVTVTFATTEGHVLGDIWAILTMTPARVNLDSLGNLLVYKNKGGFMVALDGEDMKAHYPAQLILNEAMNNWLLINPATPVYSTATISAIRYRKNLTAAYNLLYDDQGRELSCVGTFTVTLLTAPEFANRFFYVSNVSTGTITIDAGIYNIYGMGDVDGAHTITLAEGISVQLETNGVDWHIMTNTSLTGGYQVFASDGTFTVPILCTSVQCLVIAGGGGGGGSRHSIGGGGGGGGGAMVSALITGLVPRATISVTVGVGGAGGIAITGNGVDGEDSSFGSYLTAKKGLKGTSGNAGPGAGGLGGDYNIQASVLFIGVSCRSNRKNLYAIDFGATTFSLYSDMDGKIGSVTAGGAGGISGSLAAGGAVPGDAAGLPGALYGAGGSGAGCTVDPGHEYAGGAGANGVVVVWWSY